MVMGLVVLVILAMTVVGIVVSIVFAGMLRKAAGDLTVGMQPQYLMLYPQPVGAPAPGQIKKAVCRNCGGYKVKPPKSACLYCDFCGALVDWDFRIAVTTAGSARPGPELQRLMAQEKAVQEQARAHGDRQGFAASVRRIYEQHLSACPAAYSPRIGDPSYKSALLDYLCLADTALGFDPESLRLEAEVMRLRRMLPGAPLHGQLNPQVFQQLVEAKRAATRRAVELLSPFIDKHPDGATVELAAAVINSTFAQYWLPFVDSATQTWLIDSFGLGGEYIAVPQVPMSERHCGSCGDAVQVPSGARRVVCEGCGHFNDVSRPEIGCPGCGAPISIPHGSNSFACPYCRFSLRADGGAAY